MIINTLYYFYWYKRLRLYTGDSKHKRSVCPRLSTKYSTNPYQQIYILFVLFLNSLINICIIRILQTSGTI